MIVVSGTSGRHISEEISRALGCRHIIPETKIFSDGESYLRIPEDIDDEVLVVQSCHEPQDSNLFQLLNLVSTVRRLSDRPITVYLPYMCYARADRDILGGEAISAKTVLELIEAVGTEHLITLDVHNPDIFRYARKMKCTNIFPSKSWAGYLHSVIDNIDDLQIVAPDQGAIDRAKSLADELNLSYTHLEKKRDSNTGEVNLMVGSANFQSEEVVIVDDVMATGSTLIEATSLLTTQGVHTVHVLVSHAIGTSAVDRLRDIGGGIVASTNSIPSLIGSISSVEDIVGEIQP